MGRTASRWADVGHSNSRDSATAAREASLSAIGGRADAHLLVVFCSEVHANAEFITALAEIAGDTPLIGCSTAGEITTNGPGDCGAVVFALGGPGITVETRVAEHASSDLRAAGMTGASGLLDLGDAEHRVLLMLTDALAGDQQEIIRGAYSVAGATVPLVGGCAGDDLHMEVTHQFHGERIMTNAVVTAAIGSDGPIGIGVCHGWHTVGDPMLVTRSAGNIVYEIDDRPALDVYLDRLEAPQLARTDARTFTQFALEHPLGLARRGSEPHVRLVSECDPSEGSLVCIAAVPEGSKAWIMRGDTDSVLVATDSACEEAFSALGGLEPLGIVAFDCIARRSVLGEAGITREVQRIADNAPGAPVAGFYTYGEIARTAGISGFHNETLVVLAFA